MTTNLYAKYLLADRIQKAAEKCGTSVATFNIRDSRGGYSQDLTVFLDSFHRGDGKGREVIADKMLTALPFLTLARSEGSIDLKGTTNQGLTVCIYAGDGICERVQVGTRKIAATEAFTVPASEEREEPIYEVRCIDSLTEAVSA